jgi:serralysin
MATNFITTTSVNVPVANGDQSFLLPGNTITSTTDGVTLASGLAATSFLNYGTVLAGGEGVEILSQDATVVNNGVISAVLDGIDLQHSADGASFRILNNGDITAGRSVIDVDNSDVFSLFDNPFGFSLALTNNGTRISTSDSDLISTTALLTSVSVMNTGLMQGGTLYLDGLSAISLSNTGIIRTPLISASETTPARIFNSGEIIDPDGVAGGNVLRTGILGDTVVNTGLISGDVQLALGDDRFETGGAGHVLGTVLGGGGSDTITGGANADTLSGDTESDVLIGRGGDDSLDGGSDNDVILGGSGNDSMHGGSGNDTLNGGGDNDTIYGEGNNDAIVGQDGADYMDGGSGNDTIDGGAGNDVLEGGDDNDVLRGRDGEDELAGGLGLDFLTGGADADVFVFRGTSVAGIGATRDQILDFEQGVDLISVVGMSPGVFEFRGTSSFAPSGNSELRLFETSTGSTIVQFDVDGDGAVDAEIRVAGVTGLTADDFAL